MHRPTAPAAAFLALLLAAAAPLPAAARAAAPEAPVPAPVTISSTPSGAALSVDGLPRGATPVSVPLAPGRHVARLAPEGAPATFVEFEAVDVPSDVHFELPAPVVPVLLVSEPEGASVTRDGASAGVTPALLPDVPPGHHTFVFELAGHRPQTLETDLAAPAPVRLFARLVSTSASLHVTSEPAGASVSLNGAPRGATPLDLDGIPEGEATLELSLPGHAPFRTQVRLAAGERFSVNAPLDPLPGRLSVVTLPAGARVYVDNQYRGQSPFVLEEAAPREYRVRVELAGHDPAARTVAIGPGEERTEEFRLAANVGSVSVSTSPAGVDVLVDGVRRGTTAAKDGAAVSAPLVLADVPAGHHRLTFSRPGYAEASAEVDVARNVTATVPTVELRRRFLPDVVLRTRNGGEIRGVFVEQTKEFYRLETSPGITRSIPLDDIIDWKPLDSTSEAPSK